jgi:hypothetical protein
MEFDEFKADELRKVTRHFAPETKGMGGLAHVGSKQQLIEFLQERGVMPCEAQEYLAAQEHGVQKEDEGDQQQGIAKGYDQQPKQQDYFFEETPLDEAIAEVEEQYKKKQQQEDAKEQYTKAAAKDAEDDEELEILRRIITKKVQQGGVDRGAVESIVDEKLQNFRDKMVKTIQVKKADMPEPKEIGVCHYLTEQIAQVCNIGVHQMLVGPAGGGKTTCCEKVAEILDLKFYPMSVGPQTTKSDLLGFIDAAGNYHTTPLREAFENGGLLLLDEVDAANAGVLTIIDALLANGYCSFPDGVKKRNEDFRCICACNTYGRGADRQYVGRNQLDAATLDRFAVVDFEYDEAMERAIAGNNEWVDKVQKYRKRAFDLKQRVVISPRASIFGAKLLANGMKESLVEDLVLWKGIAEDIRKKITA